MNIETIFDMARNHTRKTLETGQNELSKRLLEAGVDESKVLDVLDSGYYWFAGQVRDMFYGNKQLIGSIPFEWFVRNVKNGNEDTVKEVPTYRIRSIDDALKILQSERHRNQYDAGYLCFRGQTKKYTMKRAFPNPEMRNKIGEEHLLIPSIWRKYIKDTSKFNFRNSPSYDRDEGVFISSYAHDLIFRGIDVNSIMKNTRLISDLEDSLNPEKREYFKRWSKYLTGSPSAHRASALLEQHYGLDTNGLDVTFDIAVALFFATNKFKMENGKYTYEPINEHDGIIYCLRFRSPSLSKTNDLINEIGFFEHLPPIRPLRQSCALPFFHSLNMNEAMADIHSIFIIDNEFDTSDLPSAKYLFPSSVDDPFYEAILELKSRFPEKFGGIAEYDIK